MNWYKIFKQAQARFGEYWLIDGSAVYADSNVGVGHEGYVIQTIIDQNDINEENLFNIRKRSEMLAELGKYNIPEEEKAILVDFLLARQSSHTTDPRLFAIKNWGWKRLADANVQTWTLTPDDMRSIGRGIWDAYGEDSDKELYDVFIEANGTMYEGIPLYVFEDGNPGPSAMQNYQRRNFGGMSY